MAEGEARSVRTDSTAMALVRDLWAFAKAPSPAPARLSWGKVMLLALAVLLCIDLALALAAEGLQTSLESAGHNFPDYAPVEMSPYWEVVAFLIIAPVLEEALFRGWLSGTRAALRFAAIVCAAIVSLIAVAMVSNQTVLGAASFLFFGIVVAGLVQWLVTRDRDTDRPDWFIRNYKWLVWGSALIFGLCHLLNFDNIDEPLDLLVVLSQTIGGIVLAYTRTRLGLSAAMVQHSAFNAAYLALA